MSHLESLLILVVSFSIWLPNNRVNSLLALTQNYSKINPFFISIAQLANKQIRFLLCYG